ncbi:MAG: DVU_1556 family methyltransferase [Desulfuromonadaceae bacterium]
MTVWTPDTCRTLIDVTGAALRPGGLDLTGHLLSFGNFTPGSRILDAGCGLGTTLKHLATTGHTGALGVDSSLSMLAAARSQTGGAALICAELECLPFPAASFDGIICECVLVQTAASEVLAEFQRILCADGVLLISDLYRREPETGSCQAPDDRLPTRREAETMLRDAGFTVEHWEDRTGNLKQLAARLLMESGTAQENLCYWPGNGTVRSTDAVSGFKTIGYHLLVARRDAA